MPQREAATFRVDDAQLIFRNFSGEPGPFNRDGKRSFCVVLDPDIAEQMLKDGWAVKYLKAREEGEEETPYIQITVNFKVKPPNVTLITEKNRTRLTEETINIMDFADFEKVDLIARAYEWEVGEKAGVAAYLKTMFATLEEDDLERKYAEVEPGGG